ncbi:MAG: PAS domain-containing protein [Coriobacteriia bacterium]|nr:PAS domain-containing protein [Coriobacteriia bacterium]
MEHRRVIKRVSAPAEQGVPAVLQRAAERLQAVLEADVVFASVVGENDTLHCLGITPAEKVRFAPVSLGAFPDRVAMLDDERLSQFDRSYVRPVGSLVVTVPVRGGDGCRALVTAVVGEAPDEQTLRFLDAWAGLLGERIDGERTREALDVRAATIGRLREVLDVALGTTSEAVAAIDLDGRIIRWNPGCERLYGWSVEEALGTTLPMVDPVRYAAMISLVRQIAANGTIGRIPGLTHRTAAGRILQVHATMMPLFDEDGDVYGVVAVLHDEVSSLHHSDATPPAVTEAALARLTAPVTAVSGFVQLLRREDALHDPAVREGVLRGLERRCREIADISDELRLATRLLESDPDLRLSAGDPCRAVHRALERVSEIGGRNVTTDMTEGLTVNADQDCLEGAVTGLLRGLLRSNAEDISITVVVRPEGDGVALVFGANAVESVGVSQHPESGLGIHLARLCAQVHGGRFAVRCERDATEIRLFMPAGMPAN